MRALTKKLARKAETTGHDLVAAHDEITTEFELALSDLAYDVRERRETVASRLSTLEAEDRELARLQEVI